MNQAIYERLVSVARAGDTTTYSAIAPLAGLDMGSPADRNAIAAILDEINRAEQMEGRPLLSALVLYAQENIPGPGFFDCAAAMGHEVGDDKLKFWLGELRTVHDCWKSH